MLKKFSVIHDQRLLRFVKGRGQSIAESPGYYEARKLLNDILESTNRRTVVLGREYRRNDHLSPWLTFGTALNSRLREIIQESTRIESRICLMAPDCRSLRVVISFYSARDKFPWQFTVEFRMYDAKVESVPRLT